MTNKLVEWNKNPLKTNVCDKKNQAKNNDK